MAQNEFRKRPLWLFIVFILIAAVLISMIIIFAAFPDSWNAKNLIENIGNHTVVAGALFSFAHIKTRAELFKDNPKMHRYFSLMVLFFIPITIFGIFQIVNQVLNLSGDRSFFQIMNDAIPPLRFNIFGNPAWRTTMPFDSILMFSILIFSILAFLYPIETYVKDNKRPYHSISILLCLISLLFLGLRDVMDIEIPASILTVVVISVVFINFFYLFWTYFSVAIRSPSTMRKGGLLIAVGLILIFMVWASSWIVGLVAEQDYMRALVPYTFAFLSIVSLNYGFYILKPIS